MALESSFSRTFPSESIRPPPLWGMMATGSFFFRPTDSAQVLGRVIMKDDPPVTCTLLMSTFLSKGY